MNRPFKLPAKTCTLLSNLTPLEQDIFHLRLEQYETDILRPLHILYGNQPDFAGILSHLIHLTAQAYVNRSPELRLLDLKRVSQTDWFQQPNMIGYICYVDRFAGNLAAIPDKIPYLQELGITYLHLMPLLKTRAGENDGGYAVQDYEKVQPHLGTMTDLQTVATALRHVGISLCTDLVLNHTAKEHHWAQQALAGNSTYQNYYWMFPDRTLPDQYEQTLPEVFPDFAPGNFTYYPTIDRWVWTTFNEYQWDLNYTNPAVFAEILRIMLYLANQGIEILRLDAVAFMWKRLGTNCQNQPEAHTILQAFRALTRLAAPALLLKAEAIVSPPDLVPYLGQGTATGKECELAYHNVLMVMLWSSLAERQVRLMTHALQKMPAISPHTAWITYVRCHDDIGWAVTDEDAAGVGLSGYLHRAFLSDFYSGKFAGTFSRGTTFQHNPLTHDRRINGSCASLAGLEQAIEQADPHAIDLALQRIFLLHNLIFAFGGIPLIYMGDELGLLSDYNYQQNPNHAADSRWIHRPQMDWTVAEHRHNPHHLTGQIFSALQHLIHTRQQLPAFHAQAATTPIWTHNDTVFGLIRHSTRGQLLILANFSEHPQTVSRARLNDLGFAGNLTDHLTTHTIPPHTDVHLTPYQACWLS